ncbi:MAG TPA: hypothetical protein VH414_08255 [Lichenihabitans sp.]|jgi:hypothetical protein|nr:hypothetical protein [Lichenihabitans sp.]
MRSKIIALVIGCGIAAVAVIPALACPFNTQASSGSQATQQTAQAQTPPTNAQ